jgi:ABC-type transport system substrate-binding protein
MVQDQRGRRSTAAPWSYRGKQRDRKIRSVAAWPSGNVRTSRDREHVLHRRADHYSGDKALHALASESDSTMDPDKRREIGRKMFDLATEKVYFYPVAPYPSILVHTKEVSVGPAERFTPFGYEVSDIRWK